MTRRRTLALATLGLLLLSTTVTLAQTEHLVPGDFATIQSALEAAEAGDTVTVSRGTYSESFALKADVVVQGEETAATFLTGTVSGSGGTLQRFTLHAPTYRFRNAHGLVIRNCVVIGTAGATGIAIEVENSADIRIANNVFHANFIGLKISNVDGGSSSGTVVANVFSENNTALLAPSQFVVKDFNLFHQNSQDGDTGGSTVLTDPPLFVDLVGEDFHLRMGSGCIDAVDDGSLDDPDGSPADCGAYGGPDMDQNPAMIKGLTTIAGAEEASAEVRWAAGSDYLVGGYRLYYGTSSGDQDGTGATEGPSPIEIGDGAIDSVTLTGLPIITDPPPAPTSLAASPGDRRLYLSWGPAPAASGYIVLYGTQPGTYTGEVDAGDATAFTLTGLASGTPYFIAVRSYANTTYYFAVSALGTAPADTLEAPEGQPSEETSVIINVTEGEQTGEVSETPERISGYPELEDNGFCFIATLGACDGAPGLWAWWAGLGSLTLLLTAALTALRRRTGFILIAALTWGLFAAAGIARAQDSGWSLDARAGASFSADASWGDHYDSDVMLELKAGVGYRLAPWIEFGAEAGYRRAEGTVRTTAGGRPLSQPLDQTLTVYPLQAYAKLSLQLSEQQLLVPYLAAGPTRYLYRHEVDGADSTQGHRDGYHVRGGLRLSLSSFDPDSSARARAQFGLASAGLTLEGQYAQVDDFGAKDTNLGGWALFAGFDLRF